MPYLHNHKYLGTYYSSRQCRIARSVPSTYQREDVPSLFSWMLLQLRSAWYLTDTEDSLHHTYRSTGMLEHAGDDIYCIAPKEYLGGPCGNAASQSIS